jgi:hypothetical protein
MLYLFIVLLREKPAARKTRLLSNIFSTYCDGEEATYKIESKQPTPTLIK